MESRTDSIRFIAVLISTALWLTACGEATSNSAPPAPRPHLVELATASTGRLAVGADRAGSLRALREVRIVNQEEGEVVAVNVREGDRVTRGQVLVRYDDRILTAELDKAVASLKQAELEHERNRKLIAQGFIGEDALTRSATALDIAEAQRRLLATRVDNLTLRAPFAGVISQRRVEPGTVTGEHTHLLTLLDPSTLITDVDVSELVLPFLKVGDAASVRIDALPGDAHDGRIVRIHPANDPASRTGRIEVALDPVPPGARPGQLCRVELAIGGGDHVLVPLSALRRDGDGEFVFVFGDDVVRRVGVASGLRLGDRVEIRSGLAAGAQVVTKGFIGLAPGRPVKPVTAPG
jgi:membrane fusion protein (multidrug efflux system)